MHNIFQSAPYVIPLTLLDAIGLTQEKGECKLPTEASWPSFPVYIWEVEVSHSDTIYFNIFPLITCQE